MSHSRFSRAMAPAFLLLSALTSPSAAEAPRPADADGVDLLPFLTKASATPPRDDLFIRYQALGQRGRMLRVGPLKLLDNENGVKLFDVVADPGEQRDLAASRPQDVARLEARWQALSADLRPPLWRDNPRRKPVTRSGEQP